MLRKALWLFPISLLAAALAIAGAARKYTAPPRALPSMAVVNSAELLRRDPVARTLLRIRKNSRTFSDGVDDARSQNRDARLPESPLLEEENRRLAQGFSYKHARFGDLVQKSMDDTLRDELASARANFNLGMDAEYKALVASLDDAFKDAVKSDSNMSVFSRQLEAGKSKLARLRLQLDTLTFDKINTPRLKPDEMKARKSALELQIKSLEKILNSLLIQDKLNETSRLRENFQKEAKSKSDEFDRQLQVKIDAAEKETLKLIRDYEEKLDGSIASSIEKRSSMQRGLDTAPAPAATAPEPAPAADLSGNYVKIFTETVGNTIKAEAAARDIQIVLDSPLYHSGQAQDLTGFILPDAPAGK